MQLQLDPHVRMFWRNTVDVIAKNEENDAGRKIGSFVTYGKIMACVMRFFGVQFENIEINGRMHFVRREDLETFKQSLPLSENAASALFDQNIESLKKGVSGPKITSPVNSKISIFSSMLGSMVCPQDKLEMVLGNEFQPIRDKNVECPLAVFFLPYTQRPTAGEIDVRLTEKPTAVVINLLSKDLSKAAHPSLTYELVLARDNHRIFHILTTEEGLNDCTWNENEVAKIRQFLKNQAQVA